MTTYSDKLKSPIWQKKRLEILERDSFKCVICEDNSKTLHVHHVYEDYSINPWEHDIDTLITLCEDCHKSWHHIFNCKLDPYLINEISKKWLEIENICISKSMKEIELKQSNNLF